MGQKKQVGPMEFELSLRQCIDVHDLPRTLKEASISVDGITSLDIAINAESVKPTVKAFRATAEAPDKVKEYSAAIQKARLTLKGADLQERLRQLNLESADDLDAENGRQQELEKELDSRMVKVKLNPIPFEKLSGESAMLSLIMSAVLPILTKEGKLVTKKGEK